MAKVADERAERARAQDLLRACAALLKEAGVSQNRIASQAAFSSGYMPQLLKDDDGADRLTRPTIARLTTAIDVLSREAGQRLADDRRAQLRQHLESLRAAYGQAKRDIARPRTPLGRNAGNYVHRKFDGLLIQELANHDDLTVAALVGAPGAGKTWAMWNLTFAAEDTHETFWIDLSQKGYSSGESPDRVVRLVLEEVHRHRRLFARAHHLPQPENIERAGHEYQVEDVAAEIEALAALVAQSVGTPGDESTWLEGDQSSLSNGSTGLAPDAVAADPRILLLIDGPDRAGSPTLLLRLVHEMQTTTQRYFPHLRKVFILLAAENTYDSPDKASSSIRPTIKVGYFSDREVKELFTTYQQAGVVWDITWEDVRAHVQALGGHPWLVSQFFDDCYQLGKEEALQHSTVSKAGSGWAILKHQLTRMVRALEHTDASTVQALQARLSPEPSEREKGTADVDAVRSALDPNHVTIGAALRAFGLWDDVSRAFAPFVTDEVWELLHYVIQTSHLSDRSTG